MRGDDLSVVNQQAGLTLDQLAETAVDARKIGDEVVQQQQGSGGNDPSEQGRVRPGHGVLHGVADKEEQGEVKGRHLPDLALAAQPHAQQDDGVDDRRPQGNFDQNMPAGKHRGIIRPPSPARAHSSGCSGIH